MTKRRSQPSTPLLDDLMARGLIIRRDDGWTLIAADGVECALGLVSPIRVERYLQDFPTPDKW